MFNSQILKKNKKKNKENAYDKKIKFLGYFIAIIIPSVVAIYVYNFKHLGLSNDQEKWAQFGDYIGGTLNPILAFFAFVALLITIKLQNDGLQQSKDELELTRKELEKSAMAQEKQSKSLELQNKATNLQIFENTFFSLLKENHKILDNLYEDRQITSSFLSDFLEEGGLERKRLRPRFDRENNGFFKTYFMMLYQLLKFVDNAENSINKKTYTNIIRANLGNEILSLLAINCYVNDFQEYKGYLEKYSFFEHLDISSPELIYMTGILIDGYSDISIYGDNSSLIKKLNSHKKVVLTQFKK